MESSFIEVAKHAGPIGLALFVLFALVKGLLALDIFTKMPSDHTYKILNNLLNVVLVICLVAMVAGLIGKCNDNITTVITEITPPDTGNTKSLENSKYTIVFDEIVMTYLPISLSENLKSHRICFKVNTGTQTETKQINNRLGSFFPSKGLATPIPLKLRLEDVKAEQECSILLGFDPSLSNACTENAEISFPFTLGKMQFDYANNAGGAVMPLRMNLNNFSIEIKYRIVNPL